MVAVAVYCIFFNNAQSMTSKQLFRGLPWTGIYLLVVILLKRDVNQHDFVGHCPSSSRKSGILNMLMARATASRAIRAACSTPIAIQLSCQLREVRLLIRVDLRLTHNCGPGT